MKLDKNFIKVTKINIILTIIENIGFFAYGYWNIKVLIGSIWGLALTSLFFFMICVSIEQILRPENSEDAAKMLKKGQGMRMLVLAVGIVGALKRPFLYWPAALIPLIFTRISAGIVGLTSKEEE